MTSSGSAPDQAQRGQLKLDHGVPARKSAVPKSGTAPAFTKAHAKRTGRSPSAVAQDAAKAKTLVDETLQRIAGTSLDTPSEIAALAAMDEASAVQPTRSSARTARGLGTGT
jgi:hypothetical protein